MTGLLVTFLGTPCTAPFLGPALGYAFTQNTANILLFLAVVGLGLSTPFLVLSVWTGWTRILPTRVSPTYDSSDARDGVFVFWHGAVVGRSACRWVRSESGVSGAVVYAGVVAGVLDLRPHG